MLIHQAYVDGTKRYVYPDCFLYFPSCLCAESGERDTQLNLQLRKVLGVGLRERIGLAGGSLSIAARALACQTLGIDSRVDVNGLLRSQTNDGSWNLARCHTTIQRVRSSVIGGHNDARNQGRW